MLRHAAAIVGGRMKASVRRTAVMAAGFAVALLFVLLGLAALMVAGVILLVPNLGPAGAAATMGGVALFIALLVMLIASRRPQPAPAARVAPASSAVSSDIEQLGNDMTALTRSLTGTVPEGTTKPLNLVLGAIILGLVLGRKV